MTARQNDVAALAQDAENQVALAEAAAAAATSSANASIWVSGQTYAIGVVRFSPINFLSYRRKTAGAGTTDPSLDAANWALVAGTGDVTLTGTQTLTNKTFGNYTETVYNLTGTEIASTNGPIQYKTLAGNTTFTEALTDGQSVILGITAGSFTVTWPAGILWTKVGGSGVAPTLTSTGANWVVLWQVGGTVRGSFLGTA
jgi:hypothetical protein